MNTLLLAAVVGAGLNTAQFRNPPAEFYPSVFWLWNYPMTPERIRGQIADMDARQLRTLCILPMPRDFRPQSTGNLLDVDYLSGEYFARYRIATEEAARRGMKSWLYDEGGWPSGSAVGRVVRSDPSLGAQTLVVERRPGAAPTWHIRRDPFQPDRLNPRATERFIELTHEGYRRAVGGYLGKTIPWTFTDEPGASPFIPGRQLPWTDGLPALFQRKKGHDLMAALPLLTADPPLETPEAVKARIDFFDVWSALYAEAYLGPLRDWSRRNGLLSGGHMNGEDETMGSARYGHGHILRALRALDLPGVDAIWRQIFPGKRNHHFPRFASSVARQAGRRLVFTESFAVYGNGLTPAEMKWILDYQYVRGCNLLVMACYPAGTRGHLMAGERPHFGPVDPLWPHQPLFQDYAARLGYLLSLGEAATDVALYFPVRDLWAGAPARETPESRANDDVALEMERNQMDFDFVDDDLLRTANISGGTLRAGSMTYRTLVVSRARMLPDETAQAMALFVGGGGRLIAVDALPETGPVPRKSFRQHLGASAGQVVLTPLDKLGKWLRPPLVLGTDSLRATARRLPEGMLYFITNEADEWAPVRLPRGRLLDPETGEIRSAPPLMRMAPWGSAVLLAGGSQTNSPPAAPNESTAVPLPGRWQVKRISATVIEAGDYRRKEFPNDTWRPVSLGDWKEAVGADFSGTAEYYTAFNHTGPAANVWIDLGRVAAVAEVWLNGRHLGARAWPPYRLRATGLRAGANEFRVRVTNTLASYLASPAVRAAWAAHPHKPWPGPYDARAHAFEKESTAGGLFGPVRLLRESRE